MEIPGWLMRIIALYLKQRTLVVRYKGGESEPADLPGGVGAVTLLELWLLLVMMNRMAMGGEDDLNIGNTNKKESIKKCKKKWIDDLTIANVIDLKDCKKVTEDNLIRPLNFHGRTEHVLYPESNPAQKELAEIFALAQEKQMVVNRKKTKAMIFNPSRNIDFEPFLYDPNGETIDYVQQTKLLGVITLDDQLYICLSSGTVFVHHFSIVCSLHTLTLGRSRIGEAYF